MSFSSEVDDFILDFEEATDRTIRASAIALFGAIIKSSPVDEGTFRSNWYVRANKPSNQVNPNGATSESAAVQIMTQNVLSIQNYKRITLTNNLPYAEVIEFGGYPTGNIRGSDSKVTYQGYSKQAPQGVVRANVLRFRGIFEQQAKKNGFQ